MLQGAIQKGVDEITGVHDVSAYRTQLAQKSVPVRQSRIPGAIRNAPRWAQIAVPIGLVVVGAIIKKLFGIEIDLSAVGM